MVDISPDSARMIDRLERLVAINTENPPGRESEAAAFLAAELGQIGFTVEQQDVGPGRVNVVARFDNGPGPCLAFNSHIDVVPAGSGWSHPAFQLHARDGRLYGRGSCDAKGPIVAMLEAARMMIAGRDDWRGSLLAVFVADEEAESRGAKAYAAGRPTIDYAVIGEPTSNGVAIAHKGSLRPIVRVTGVTAHSGSPELGVNAIFHAAALLRAIEVHHRDHVCKRHHPLVGAASLTVTRINGGLADNIIPDGCELLLDRRLIPGESEADAIAELERLLKDLHKQHGIAAEIVGFKPTTGGATETAADHPLVRAATSAASTVGASGDPTGFAAACDLVHFRTLGAAGVVVGPGSLAVAHKPDEFVPVDEFVGASRLYLGTALDMLHRAGSTR
ncbi:MAG: M20 family metallopeptidase [Proteobacteria bacterium]|nr:M20 family metallopeptidase [Pseudomonadota bacterium]